MVSANYYYDFDMSEQNSKKKKREFKMPSGRVVAIFALVVVVLLGIILFVSFILTDDKSEKNGHSDTGFTESFSRRDNSENSEEEYTENIEDNAEEISHDICTAGSGAFTLDENGRVVRLDNNEDIVQSSEAQNGASFTLNVTPYETDYNTWNDAARLYNDPDGAMLFAVMENGTVAFDIFSSSTMNYEAAYKAVSSWRDVSELVWESGKPQSPCLFAIKKDGTLYVSDEHAEKIILEFMQPTFDSGKKIDKLSAKDGCLYIIMDDGSFNTVMYR